MELINKKKFLTLVLTLDAWRLPYACDACPSKIEPQFYTINEGLWLFSIFYP